MGAQSDVIEGAKAIAAELGISPKRIGRAYAAGAPIKALGQGSGVRYLASRAALRYWLSTGVGELRAASGSFG
jgi:hypothetical protein